MAVAFDTVGPTGGGGAAMAGVTVLSWTHTPGSAGVALVADAAIGASPDTGFSAVCALDPSGANTNMPSLGLQHVNNTTSGFEQLFGLANVGSGAHTVQVTVSGGTPTTIVGGSESYTGADTVSPFSTAQTAFGSGATPTLGFTGSTSGNVVSGGMAIGTAGTITMTSGTQRWSNPFSGATGAGNSAGGDIAAGGTVTLTWNPGGSDFWAVVAVEVKVPAASAAPPAALIPPGLRSPMAIGRHFPPQPVPPPVAAAAPTTGPPVYPLRGPVAAVTRPAAPRGRLMSDPGIYSQTGPPVTALDGPVIARRPGPFRAGRTQNQDGRYSQLGPPVTPLDGPVVSRGRGLPPRGRAQGRAGTFTAAAPSSGPPVYPLQRAVRARLPLWPLRKGRTATMVALPLFYAGPPVTPLRGPVRTRPQPPPRGRSQGRAGVFTSVAPQSGPPVYPLHGPVRTRPQPPPRGRATGNDGTFNQAGPPVTPLHGPVYARRPSQLRGGRCRGSAGTFTFVGIQSGPPVYPLHGPVRTRPQPPPRGRCQGGRGIRHQTGPSVTPLRGPVAPFRPGPYRSGRCTGNDGTSAQLGPRVYPLRGPVRGRIPHRPRGGRIGSDMGAPVFVPPFTIGVLTATDQPRNMLTAAGASSVLTASGAGLATLTANDQRTGGPGG